MMMVVNTFLICVCVCVCVCVCFEYYMAIFLVMPGKPSFRRLDSMSAYGIERALVEVRRRSASQ